ncbi:MAG TPA: VapC toxin family PIN domain ribonuclease [Hyphomonadaceae bacterium]|nr:VapC toxin family PIN domain ribonuclease [Hyphomonadaceae bacterium]
MVVSERTKSRPDAKVCTWLHALDPKTQFISVITIGEIRFGVERLAPSPAKARLQTWLEDLKTIFAGRILPVDLTVCERWGHLRAKVGRSLSVADALIGATAFVHGLAIATRNEHDFKDFGVRVSNPWL